MTYRRYSQPRPARWIDLRYAGTCCRCQKPLPKGTRAFYDPSDRTVCCTELKCAEAHGLTKSVWHGSPVSGRWVETLSEQRYRSHVAEAIRDPGEDAADRWSEQYG